MQLKGFCAIKGRPVLVTGPSVPLAGPSVLLTGPSVCELCNRRSQSPGLGPLGASQITGLVRT